MPPSQKNLLFLSHGLPYPPDRGVSIRALNVLRQLRKEFDVTLLTFARRNHQPDAAGRRAAQHALSEFGLNAYDPVTVPSDYSRARLAWDHLRSVATRRAYTFYQYQSATFRQQLRDVLSRTKPSLIHIDSIDLHGTLPHLPALPVACTHVDIESHALRRRAAHARTAVRMYLQHQSALVERTERRLCPIFAANLVMSELDAQRLRALVPTSNVVVSPNGVDTAYFTPATNGRSPTGRVVFVGGTFFEPNRDAVDSFLTDVWPRVRARHQPAAFHVIGRGSSSDHARFASHSGVTTHGNVPDVRPHFAEADCAVVPIRFGGGTRIKILDAWAMGKAVVSTSVGCEGLRAMDGENILVRDSPTEFADAVTEVLGNAALRTRLGTNGRRTVEEFYSWDVLGSQIRELYHSLI